MKKETRLKLKREQRLETKIEGREVAFPSDSRAKEDAELNKEIPFVSQLYAGGA